MVLGGRPGAVLSPFDLAISGRQLHAGPLEASSSRLLAASGTLAGFDHRLSRGVPQTGDRGPVSLLRLTWLLRCAGTVAAQVDMLVVLRGDHLHTGQAARSTNGADCNTATIGGVTSELPLMLLRQLRHGVFLLGAEHTEAADIRRGQSGGYGRGFPAAPAGYRRLTTDLVAAGLTRLSMQLAVDMGFHRRARRLRGP